MTDPLAVFWAHTVQVRRFVGEGASGAVLSDSAAERGNVSARNQMVRDASGDEIVSSATVAFPPSVAQVAPGSLVELPAEFGGRTAKVVAVSASNLGAPFPDTQVIHLE
ncbi:hypothetical protein [Nocardia testacea]|uniref:hypothetical protein n=1 Tax=Nocardia testacea TaxID=248551 RepID=UPI0002DFC0CB|nr:hypothetical protein [Nocardia testacea]